MGIIDPEAIRRLEQLNSPGAEDIVLQLIEVFVGKSKDRQKEFQAALEAMDFEKIYAAAHALRSGSANLGLKALNILCGDIETAARAKDRTTILNLHPGFLQCWSESIQALERLRKERSR